MSAHKTRPIPELKDSKFLEFRYKIDDGEDSECWNWQGRKDTHGYGLLSLSKYEVFLAHRIAFKICNNKDPIGFVVAHKCDNPTCCNPNHLFMATDAENMHDRTSKGRTARQYGTTHGRHTLCDAEILAIRKAYETGGETYMSLSKKFPTSASNIGRIVVRKAWPHI